MSGKGQMPNVLVINRLLNKFDANTLLVSTQIQQNSKKNIENKQNSFHPQCCKYFEFRTNSRSSCFHEKNFVEVFIADDQRKLLAVIENGEKCL